MSEESGARAIDTGTNQLECQIEERVALITLNRPEARNALTMDLKVALLRVVEEMAEASDVGCLLLTGAGRAFCSGGDTTVMSEGGRPPSMEDRQRQLRWEHRLPLALHRLSKPTIAALPGAAAGAGYSLALACDLRIAADSAFMLTSFAKLGLSGDYGGSWFTTQLVGTAKAREIYFGAERMTAAECLALGLVNRVVADDELGSAALAWARQLAAGPPVAYRYMKENLNRAMHADLETCLDYEADRMVRGAMTDDYREAVKAFMEKRRPVFEGR